MIEWLIKFLMDSDTFIDSLPFTLPIILIVGIVWIISYCSYDEVRNIRK